MNHALPQQSMAVMQRPPSEEEKAFAMTRDRAVFAMDVLRLGTDGSEKMADLRFDAIEVLKSYLSVGVRDGT